MARAGALAARSGPLRSESTLAHALRRAAPLWLIAPSLLLALFIIGYPVFDLVRTATHEVNRFGQLRDFIGMAHFAGLFADELFWDSLWRTLIWTGGVVLGTIAISVPVAMILNEDFAGRGLARVIVMLPWAISLTMTAIVWRWTLNGQAGMLNATLFQLGAIEAPIEWLPTAQTAFPMQIAIGILVSIPFTTTVFLGGLSSVPEDIYEAARIDGATGWQRFRHLTLPLLRPFINIVLAFTVIYAVMLMRGERTER